MTNAEYITIYGKTENKSFFWLSFYLQDGTQDGATLEAVSIDDAENQLRKQYGQMYGGLADYGTIEE